jgi:hypothetical protein
MTISNQVEGAAAPTPPGNAEALEPSVDGRSYLDWGAIIAGAVLAAAISFVLYSFGAALGLSFSSPQSGSGASGTTFVIFAGAWLVLTQVASFGVGGYLAGRLRRRIDGAKSDEVDLRDGSHGLLVWAVVILVSTVLLTSGLFSAAQTTANAVGGSVSAVAEAVPDVDTEYLADTLMRDGSAEGSTMSEETRETIGRIVQQTLLTGELNESDMAYLKSTLADATGLEASEVDARMEALQEQVADARQAAVEAADTARRWAVLAGFLAAAVLLVSAASAYLAAAMGGRHRDSGTAIPRWSPAH